MAMSADDRLPSFLDQKGKAKEAFVQAKEAQQPLDKPKAAELPKHISKEKPEMHLRPKGPMRHQADMQARAVPISQKDQNAYIERAKRVTARDEFQKQAQTIMSKQKEGKSI
ncbi:hypothetical protein [Geminicoccus roseus]|uniref:hypothetical protein n=1 Tax=Geminicoccus roseus TaxID=404900 RepID=UPI0012FBB53A|nr:hypothetical protein [Geminicoccus roseus]